MKNKIIKFLKENKESITHLFVAVLVTAAYFAREASIANLRKAAFSEGFKLGYRRGSDSGAKAMSDFLSTKVIDFDKLATNDTEYQDSVLVNYLNK